MAGGLSRSPVRGGRQLRRYRVTRHGVFVCECRTPEEVAAAGVPLDQLTEEADAGAGGAR
jgi:hypothetical protein